MTGTQKFYWLIAGVLTLLVIATLIGELDLHLVASRVTLH